MLLFDDFDREDSSPARPGEDSFTFLNRIDTPFWAEVRRLLEEWFRHYPVDHAEDLRKAFRSRLPGSHWAAWWELYLHELCTRLGYALTIHPPLPDSAKRPDFELRLDDSRLFLEATVVFSGIAAEDGNAGAPAWMLGAVEEVTASDFFIRLLEVEAAGSEQLKRSEISRPLEEWLGGLDPDAPFDHDSPGETSPPQKMIERRGWRMLFQALPVDPRARGRADHRPLAGGPMQVGWVDDVAQLRDKLKAKAGRYGRPEAPFVTAVLCMSPMMKLIDIDQALFGSEAMQVTGARAPARLVRLTNGFWFGGDGPRNRRVSAVLAAVNLNPWNVVDVSPHLWLNPWADRELTEDWPFPRSSASDRGEVTRTDAHPELGSLFDLPSPWPPGEPFPRDPR